MFIFNDDDLWLLDNFSLTELPDKPWLKKCDSLDMEKGCVLKGEEKPFECRLWPVVVMRKNDEILVTLAPDCPACDEKFRKAVVKLLDDELLEKIKEKLKENDSFVMAFQEGYEILKRI